ncbi:MAG: hypothetical protein LKG31_00990 [Lactobacillus sp.]|jgi:hypothetical protein|nr:hypothetical protein [Lactobacillus sp.]
MLFPYGSFRNGLVMSYTPWRKNDKVAGGKSMKVNFEQRTKQGHKVAIYDLPTKGLVYNLGFTSLEQSRLRKIINQYADDLMKQADQNSN